MHEKKNEFTNMQYTNINLILASGVIHVYLVIRPTDVAGASSAVTPKRRVHANSSRHVASFGPRLRASARKGEEKQRNEREKKEEKKRNADEKGARRTLRLASVREHMCVNACGVVFAAAIAERSRA